MLTRILEVQVLYRLGHFGWNTKPRAWDLILFSYHIASHPSNSWGRDSFTPVFVIFEFLFYHVVHILLLLLFILLVIQWFLDVSYIYECHCDFEHVNNMRLWSWNKMSYLVCLKEYVKLGLDPWLLNLLNFKEELHKDLKLWKWI